MHVQLNMDVVPYNGHHCSYILRLDNNNINARSN